MADPLTLEAKLKLSGSARWTQDLPAVTLELCLTL